jgi:hypothetical protein
MTTPEPQAETLRRLRVRLDAVGVAVVFFGSSLGLWLGAGLGAGFAVAAAIAIVLLIAVIRACVHWIGNHGGFMSPSGQSPITTVWVNKEGKTFDVARTRRTFYSPLERKETEDVRKLRTKMRDHE